MSDAAAVVEGVVDAAKAFGPGVTVFALVGVLWRSRTTIRRLVHLVDDLAGEEARPGVPARPGLMDRLDNVERGVRAAQETAEVAVQQTTGFRFEMAAVVEQQAVVAQTLAELRPNGGRPMFERLDQIERLAARAASHRDPTGPVAIPRQVP